MPRRKFSVKKTPIIPKSIPQGGTLGVVAPAGPFDTKKFEKGLSVLTDMGFNTVVPDGLFEKYGFLAGSDGHRADLIHRFFADDAVHGIICARGGYGSMRILPLLDFRLIRKNPKPFIGFSDVSALLNLIHAGTGLVTFHGPMVTTLPDASVKTIEALASALSLNESTELFFTASSVIRPGLAAGTLFGGNLATLCHLVGTPFAPSYKGCILLLEDNGEAPYRIDRMLTHMVMAGAFKGVAGIVLGSFTECQSEEAVFDIFAGCFAKSDIPILGGFEMGHGKENLTVPIGLPAFLDTNRRALIVSAVVHP